MSRVVGLLAGVVFAFFIAPSRAAVPGVTAGLSRAPLKIDGRLDDPAWADAGVIENLVQQDPHPGKPTPFDTRVLLLHDATHLYIGIIATDPRPARLAVHSLERDAGQDDDDHVTIVLDTFDSQRTGYIFYVNAGGARTDGLISPSAFEPSNDFNAVWRAQVARLPRGWSAEIAIDTQSLEFDPNNPVWGLNISRYVPRRQLTLKWAGLALNAQIDDLSRAGLLRGMAGLHQGLGLEVAPYGLVRSEPQLLTGHRADAGVDIKYHLTPQLVGIATINPDFAEAEADTQQINLTRFPLFFPEKRAFFLEGSNLFGFASGRYTTGFTPYYSRRIGLSDGLIVPIDAGVKTIGHAGRFSIGMLDVETRETAIAPAKNLFVGRTAYNVNRHLRIGALITHGNPDAEADNTYAGVDAIWHTSRFFGDKTLNLYGWAAKSYGDLPDGRTSAWGTRMQYPNDVWYSAASIHVFGDAFHPALGFLPRPGTRQYHTELDYRPRPATGLFAWVRQFQFDTMYDWVDDLDGHRLSSELQFNPFTGHTEAGYDFEFTVHRRFESLAETFEITPGTAIAAGDYWFNRYHLGAGTPDSWPAGVFVEFEGGDFFGGTLRQYAIHASMTLFQGRLRLEVDSENDYGYLPQGNFIQRLHQLGVGYSFNPNLLLSTLAQYDSLSDSIGVNTRLEWIISPGRRLFFVWNHGIADSVTDLNLARRPPVNALIVKLQWDFRW